MVQASNLIFKLINTFILKGECRIINLTRAQAQRFCDPIIEFLQHNPEIMKKISREIEEIKRKNSNKKDSVKKD